jgi:NAD(P)-dependent dehydrogenase (short-subunit alcohol dehydrogenase family)
VGLHLPAANDLARHNILMNEVAPGWTMTDLNRKLMTDEDLKAAAAKIPLQRLADPSEISKVVLFLASELNTYIVGQSIS